MQQLLLSLLFLVLLSCSKDDSQTPIEPPVAIPDLVPKDEIITIPIVVHVLKYAPSPYEVSDEKIYSQIKVLNHDYRKNNNDWNKTPDEFLPFVADMGIEFKLASLDPEGNPTTGIIRTEGTVTGWEGKDDTTLYNTTQGGQDLWDPNSYLNIYVANISTYRGDLGIPGFSTYDLNESNTAPINSKTDAVVIDARVFGTAQPLVAGHHLGRTATHEIGHWLGLYHIYGQQRNCEIGDYVEDTPAQYESYERKPTHPQFSCGSNDMFMNYMDLVTDDVMCMFTQGQRERVRFIFSRNGARRQLYLNSLVE